MLMVRPHPIDVVESTSSIKKVLTNARKHRSIHSLERTAYTHWTIEQFVKQATDRPLAGLTNEVGKGGWYE
jgi:transcriptional regulator of met regulon